MGLGLTKYIPFIVYIVFLIVIFLSLFYKKEYGFYLIVVLIPLQNLLNKLIQYPFGKDIIDILFLVLIVKSLLVNGRFFNFDSKLNKYIFLLIPLTYTGLWIGYFRLGFSLPINFNNPQFIYWKNFIMLPLLYFLTINSITNKNQIKYVIYIIIVILFLIDFRFFENTRYVDFSHYSKDKRNIGSTFSDLGPNEFAAFYSQMTMFFIGLLFCLKDKLKKILLSVVIVFNFYCILFLFSRGAYFACLVGLTFYGLFKKRSILIFIILLFIFWKSILPNSVLERIEMTKGESGYDHSIVARIELWSEALSEIKLNPLTGFGFGSTRYLGFKTDEGKSRKDVHNGFIEITLEQGILGLSLFLYIFYLSIKRAWVLYNKSNDDLLSGLGLGFIGMTIAALSANLFGDRWSYFNVMGYFWILNGLIYVALKEYKIKI